jgi:hypothetical protein
LERLGGSLAIRVARRLGSQGEIEALAEVMVWRGIPEHLRSDNGTESIARDLRISNQEAPGKMATVRASMAS